MKRWMEYLRFRRGTLGLIGLLTGIYWVMFILYQIPAEPVLYGFAIWLLAAGGPAIWDYLKFSKKHRTLLEVAGRAEISLENLPEAANRLEQDYQDMVAGLFQAKCQAESKFSRKYWNMMDYYTLWAHQIKTPIAAMRLLIQSESVPQSEELFDQLFKTEQYVEMVLQYMRTESGGKDLIIRQYRLENLVRKAVRKYAKSFIRGKIRLELSPIDCSVVTDEKWLVFVIEQILSNALKYTREGTVSIFMDPDRPHNLIIEDTGIGIAPEDLPRIFEKGYTGYNGRSNRKSTGIGLYLCKSIMDSLFHTISIESEPGKGTRVRLGLEHAEIQVE